MAKNIEEIMVLVVHESKQMRQLLRQKLNALGIETIVEASEMEMAFGTFKLNKFDLVVAEHTGETFRGVDFVKRIRGEDDNLRANLPIILLTVENQHDYVEEIKSLGATALLTVSFDAKALYSAIRATFETSGVTVESGKYAGPDRRHPENRPTHSREHRREAILESFKASDLPKDAAE